MIKYTHLLKQKTKEQSEYFNVQIKNALRVVSI